VGNWQSYLRKKMIEMLKWLKVKKVEQLERGSTIKQHLIVQTEGQRQDLMLMTV